MARVKLDENVADLVRDVLQAAGHVVALARDEEGFSIFDVENALLTGRIVGRQTDRRSKERKYLLEGRTGDNTADLLVVVKFGLGGELVIVTVYAG